MSQLKNCLRHNKLEYCVRIGVGFSRFIHPDLDWICRKGLEEIEAWKTPNFKHIWAEWEREFEIDYSNKSKVS